MKRLIGVISSVAVAVASVGGCGDEKQATPVLGSGGPTSSTSAGNPGLTSAGNPGCGAGLVACGLGCVNPMADIANCGGCGVLCSSGQQCLNGSCQCVAGLTPCAGCVDVNTDATNCGGCGVVCGAEQVCSVGACATSCAAGLSQCGQNCTDTTTDLSNCGQCSNLCGAGQACVAGVCTCATGTDCGGVCVDTQTDLANCGGCGNPCSVDQTCQAGVCMGGGATSGSVPVGGTTTEGSASTDSPGTTDGASATDGSVTTGSGGATSAAITSGGETAAGGAQSSASVTTGGGAQGTSAATTSGAATTGGNQTTGSSTGDDEPLSPTYQALATFYFEANGGGACLFDPVSDVHVAALSYTLYGIADWCGACAHVEGPNGSTRVRIVDLCPTPCGTNNLDLHPEAWDEIASPRTLGQVDIDWYFVPCEVSGPVGYRFKAGTTQWWTAIQVVNHRLPLESLEWSANGGSSWSSAPRYDYNYFVVDSGVGPDPFLVRITATDGQVLIDELPAPANPEPAAAGPVIQGAGQFQ